MTNKTVRNITGIAILLAIEIILQVVGNLIPTFGGVSLNLSLIPIAVCSIVYGPLGGALLGLINGIIVLFSPSTQVFFYAYAPVGTIITCLVKCTVAGAISGFVYKAIAKKDTEIGSAIASILLPIINTALFLVCAFTLLGPSIEANNTENINVFRYVVGILIGWNFVLELLITIGLTPAIIKIMKIMTRSDKHAL